MHILLTGATGYIGRRLLTVLIDQGHLITCCVRDSSRFMLPEVGRSQIRILETDFSSAMTDTQGIEKVDAAYYLIHSLTKSKSGYAEHEKQTARNFRKLVEYLQCNQVIYLGGIVNEESLSEHLSSRKAVESILKSDKYATTILRAGIIVGSGSASFEIIRDLVEKMPVMVAPKWVNTKCQPIAVKNVIQYLTLVLKNRDTYNQTFDIGGPDILTYKQMVLGFGEVRKLKTYIFTIPVMSPRLSSFWLYFITSTNYTLAVNLVKSMKIEVVCKEERLQELLNIDLIPYKEAVSKAFGKMKQNMVISSWIDAMSSSRAMSDLSTFVLIPKFGCLRNRTLMPLVASPERVWQKIWAIGGVNGWYYAKFLWKIRGFIDRMVGGIGLRRGRKNRDKIYPGDALDFWRVLVADPSKKRLLLFAEMKLPGEAWLEFKIVEKDGVDHLLQTATFRPRGLLGRLYWYSIGPFHSLVFNGMASEIVKGNL